MRSPINKSWRLTWPPCAVSSPSSACSSRCSSISARVGQGVSQREHWKPYSNSTRVYLEKQEKKSNQSLVQENEKKKEKYAEYRTANVEQDYS